MGMITNGSNTADHAMDVIAVAGFDDYKDAFRYVAQGFREEGLNVNFIDRNLGRGASVSYEGQPFVVFGYPDDKNNETLLGIIQCHGDIEELVIGSLGIQMMLKRGSTE